MTFHTETVAVPDGSFDITVASPATGTGPGLLLIPEIFGLGEYMRGVSEKLAGLGYVVAVPDLFWRVEPGWSAPNDAEGVQASMAMMAGFDAELAVGDLLAAFGRLAEKTGTAGVLGFCLGGSLAFQVAVHADPATLVSYYGSNVPDLTKLLGDVTCPAQFVFGGSDPYIPREKVDALAEAVGEHPNMEFHIEEEAGHAFHNFASPLFHNPEPADRAWTLTEKFLARTLPVTRS